MKTSARQFRAFHLRQPIDLSSREFDGFTAEREFGYDDYHAAACGWDEAALKAYWRVGNRVTCHYRASDPRQHALCQP